MLKFRIAIFLGETSESRHCTDKTVSRWFTFQQSGSKQKQEHGFVLTAVAPLWKYFGGDIIVGNNFSIYDLWSFLSSHSTSFLWGFIVIFSNGFNHDYGCVTFTPLLSAVHLPLIKHLELGGASIHFSKQASIPVLTALMCHCWLHFSVAGREHQEEHGSFLDYHMCSFIDTTCTYSQGLFWSQVFLVEEVFKRI